MKARIIKQNTEMKFYVKAPITGWHEVSEEQYNEFKKHILEHSNPTKCTPAELAEKLTRKEEQKCQTN